MTSMSDQRTRDYAAYTHLSVSSRKTRKVPQTGATGSLLMNLPGHPSFAVTCQRLNRSDRDRSTGVPHVEDGVAS